MSNASELLRQAESLAESCPTWADLSNALYDPFEGLLSRAFSTREERRRFVQTDEYREIQKVLANAVERHGLLQGATPIASPSTWFNVAAQSKRVVRRP